MKKALCVIDFIKGIVEGKGSCTNYLQEHPEVIDNTNRLIAFAHQQNIDVYHIRLAFDKDYLYLPQYAPTRDYIEQHQLYLKNTPSTEFIDQIDISLSDHIIDKKYGDIFHGNHLLQTLLNDEIDEVILTGVATDNAILNSANTAMCHNLKVTVIEDACGATSEEKHKAALSIMRGRTASDIVTTMGYISR